MLDAAKLVQAIREAPRDAVAREMLLTHYRPFLHLIAEQALGPAVRRREDASDLVQQTLLEAVAAIAKFSGKTEAEFSCWIKQILRHNISNAVRHNRAAKRDLRRESYVPDDESTATISWQLPTTGSSSPSMKVVRAESALNLAQAIRALPTDQREAVTMRHLECRSLTEIATAMNRSEQSVAGLLRRGVSALRRSLASGTI
jgi:RNA polymerase sigma-70 factor, ECF subfamily